MPSTRQMLEQAQRGNPLLVTRWHSQWLELEEEERFELLREQREAIQPVLDSLIFGLLKHQRVGRISASALGGCKRKALFGFAGAPRVGEDPDSLDLMSMGTHDHMWWQIEGVAMGWIEDVEPYVGYDPADGGDPLAGGLVGGSIDGAGHDVKLFELKTVRESKYTKIVQVNDEPDFEHLIQFDFYGDQLGVDVGSIVYQERGGGSYNEYRVERTERTSRTRLAIVEELGNHIADDTLPPQLEDCEMKQGFTYRSCPHRKYCAKAGTVTVKE